MLRRSACPQGLCLYQPKKGLRADTEPGIRGPQLVQTHCFTETYSTSQKGVLQLEHSWENKWKPFLISFDSASVNRGWWLTGQGGLLPACRFLEGRAGKQTEGGGFLPEAELVDHARVISNNRSMLQFKKGKKIRQNKQLIKTKQNNRYKAG